MLSIPICFSLDLNFTYDNNGNVITGDGKYREYNEFNQLIRIRDGNSSSGAILEEYVYHPTEDRVLAKRIYSGNNVIETVIYVNDNLVRTVTYPAANRVNTSDKIYIKDANGIVVEVKYNQEKLFYSDDHLGSTSVIINNSGQIVEETFYEPYGGIISGGNKSRFYYEGKDFSSVIDEYDFNFRKYNPDLKFFTKPDSGINNVYDPQSLNRYAFEKNNPYKYVDKDGREPVLEDLGSPSEVIEVIKNIENENSNKGANEILQIVTNKYQTASNSKITNEPDPRYIYTSQKGFIDNKHFFTNANQKSYFISLEVGSLIETLQYLGVDKSSGFSYEDLPSNYLGAKFGKSVNDKELLSDQYAKFIYGIGGTFKNDIPLNILSKLPKTSSQATKGRLPYYKTNMNPFLKAVPRPKSSKSLFDIIGSFFKWGGK